MDNINFAFVNSSFDNLDLNVTKEEMDILSSTKEEMDARKDLDVYRKNGAEEQNRKESLQAISSAIQKQSSFQQPQCSTTNDCKSEWNHDHHNYPMGCPQLSLHNQLSPPKERPQDKKTEVHISEPSEIPFSASRPNSSVDNNNGQLQKSSSNDQCLLEIEPRKNYSRCVWCSNFSSHRGKKETISFSPNNERPTSVSSGTKWKCDSKDIKVGIRELCGDECLDIFMSVQTGYPNKVSNSTNSLGENNIAMYKLPSLSGLVEATKNNRGYRELQPEHDWLICQENKEYFNDAYGITDINPLLEDDDGMSVLFLDSRGILFEWCELTQDMYILGINEMEGFANILYHPKKKCIIIKDTGEIIPDEELERQAVESAKAMFANIVKAK